ncbi:hypothetical protein [Methylomagnum sp.]
MTTSLNTSNGIAPGPTAPTPSAAPPAGTPPVASSLKPPTETQARSLPGGAAGASGLSPVALAAPPSGESAETLYYFLESVQPSSPQVLPVANPQPPSLDPARRANTAPTTATAADPRGLQGRSAVPGQHHGSTAPVTPGIQAGAQPFAGAVPPASAFGPPQESHARSVPAALSGAAGSSPYFLNQATPVSPGAVAGASVAGTSGGAYYFVDEARALAGKSTIAK